MAPDDLSEPMQIVVARRIARITFGGVLILGALVLVHTSLSWLAAYASAVISFATARTIPWLRDPDFLRTHSVCVPVVGLAVLVPLTIHMCLFLACGCAVRDFNDWVDFSLRITGPAHLALVACVIQRGRKLAAGKPALTPGTIYAITVGVSCVPFAIFLAPPMIVALTGLPFFWILRRMEVVVERERAALTGVPHVPPRAVVI
jgi:hypothetical protein